MLKVWNRLSALAGAGALLGSLTFAPACGDDEEGEKDAPTDEADTGGASDPLKAAPLTWKYIEFPDTFCRDGSKAGISINVNPDSDKLMIFLEGGGACFDALTCAANPANIFENARNPRELGLFRRDRAENPVKDWNFVYVPYCTGDTHAGSNPDGEMNGAPQKFVGYSNMTSFLKRIGPTFPGMERVLLTGISAGGFGASANVAQVMRTFPDAKGNLIDDSGPAMSSQYLATCLQKKWRETWGLDKGMLPECGDACPNPDDYILDYSLFLAKKYGDQKSGMIETTADGVITRFFGVGQNECTGSFLFDPIPADTFKAGLLDFREKVAPYPNFGTYFPEGAQHTWLSSDSVFTQNTGGVLMIDWVRNIVEDTSTQHVGP